MPTSVEHLKILLKVRVKLEEKKQDNGVTRVLLGDIVSSSVNQCWT